MDSQGNAYIAGSTNSTDFPVTLGAFQTKSKEFSGDWNAFVTKLNPTGSALIYSTYLGGTSSTFGNAIAADSQGNAYVTGFTSSTDFPVTFGAFQTKSSNRGENTFVTRLSTAPIFPDFNNDGFTDLLIQNSATGAIASWFMQASTWVGGAYFSQSPPTEYALVGVGDFSGNGGTARPPEPQFQSDCVLVYQWSR